MPTYSSKTAVIPEPQQRFYPPQGMRQPTLPSGKKRDDATYLTHRHPVLLQRLYNAADTLLNTYPSQAFVYDAYPDYLSLRLMRDRILRENTSLTEDFLQAGCPIEWLQLLADTVITELLCRMRCSYRNPNGDASTTSVQSFPRS